MRSAATNASLCANWAQDSAQTGRAATPDSEQALMEFWIMELHITVVVNRA